MVSGNFEGGEAIGTNEHEVLSAMASISIYPHYQRSRTVLLDMLRRSAIGRTNIRKSP